MCVCACRGGGGEVLSVSSAGLEKQAQVLISRGADPNAREPVSGGTV